MDKEKQFLVNVLKCFIHEEKPNIDPELDWAELMKLSSINSVTGILGYVLMQNPCEETAQYAEMLKKQCLANIAYFTRMTERARQLLKKLNAAGIDHMLFKGYVVRNYYPVPELRSFGDVDILIKPEDRQRCHELMLKQGFSVKTDWEPVYSYYINSELYEMHTEIMEIDVSDKADYKGYFAKAWDNVFNTDGHSFEPEPEFHFIYLLTHIAKHIRGSGAGIRMYMDIAVFIKYFDKSLNWGLIEKELEELKLDGFANMALTLVEKCFGVKSPIALREIENDTFEDFMDFTMDGGVFGHFGRDSGLITLKNTENKSRAATVMRRLFPSAESIESRYTYLQGNHWLLPAAWVHRLFKTRDSWSAHTAEAKSIMQTDEKEVDKLKRIYREIGL